MFYASHNWQPFFLHGTKTLAYELWEDLGFRAPDNVIVPCGAGSNVLGCEIGFSELLRAGEIDTDATHLRGTASELRADRGDLPGGRRDAGGDADRADHRRGHGHCAADPSARGAGHTARDTRWRRDADRGGDRRGWCSIWRSIGIYVEPTSAQVAAAFGKLLATGTIRPEQTTVLVLTGSGLKATPRIAELMGIAL